MGDLPPWYLGALGELHATLDARGMRASRPAGGIFAGELFTDERGEATVFVPTATEVPRLGRVEPVVVPAAELAVTVHPPHWPTSTEPTERWPPTWQATNCRVDGPIREYYLVGRQDTADENEWRTEICWPKFSTGAA